jgi:hypothetical protein
MSVKIVRDKATSLRDAFLTDGMTSVEINMGLCADFADALAGELAASGVDVTITGLDYFWTENDGVDDAAQARRNMAAPPPGLDWKALGEIDVANGASHTWIEYDGLCFDAEMTDGTENPFDLPCIRHALTELLDGDPARLAGLVESHAWWKESLEVRRQRDESLGTALSRPTI